MDELISVIIPVYKVEDYLGRCLESVVNQTYKNLEIILVDDGSPDNCPRICDEWAQKDSRIIVIHKENQGLGYARNSGIEISKGDYLTFVDSDDYLPLDAVETLYNTLKRDGSNLAIGQVVKTYGNDNREERASSWTCDAVLSRKEGLEHLGSEKRPISCYAIAKLYNKAIFTNLRFFSERCGEDVRILPDVIDACSNISIVAKVVYYYYQRDESIVHNMTDVRRLDSIKAALYVGRFLMDREIVSSARAYYQSAIIQIASMKHKKTARELLKNTYSKNEVKQFGKPTFRMRLISVGMYLPYWNDVLNGTIHFLKKNVLRKKRRV